MYLNDITLVCASTINHRLSEAAVTKSIKRIHFDKKLYFTDKVEDSRLKKDVEVRTIPKFDTLSDYSNFMLFELHQYIETTHALIIQWDGYIASPLAWREEFRDYDYIGAPWYFRENDAEFARDMHGRWLDVGNGGFSLRSKKLMRYVASKKDKVPEWFKSDHEDGVICVALRDELINAGFRFPRRSLAKQFSIEAGVFNRDFWLKKSFGFHGKQMFRRARFLEILNVK
jgi:hypothetical protein